MSQAGPSQFQEVIRQELEYSMKVELDKILATAPSNELEVRSVMWMQLKAWEGRDFIQGDKSQNIVILIFKMCLGYVWKSSLDTVSVGDFELHANCTTELLLSV